MRRALSLSAKLLVDTFVKELRGLVHDQIMTLLKAEERQEAAVPFRLERIRNRIRALESWMTKTKLPFNYSPYVSTFLGKNDDEPGATIPRSHPGTIPHALIVEMTLSIARLDAPDDRHVCAQYLAASLPGFARVASVVYNKLSESWPPTAGTAWSTQDADQQFSAAFGEEFEAATVRIIPWIPVPDWEHPGPGKHRLSPHAWVMVNPSIRNRAAINSLPGVHRDAISTTVAHRALIHSSPAAPWTLADCGTLDKVLKFLMTRQVLPDIFLPSNLLEARTWTEGSKKLFGLLDIRKTAHQYIIWIAIITSRSCPNLTLIEPKSGPADKAEWKAAVTKHSGSQAGLRDWVMKLPFKISSRALPLKGRTNMIGIAQAFVLFYLAHTVSSTELDAASIVPDWDDLKWKEKLGTHIFLCYIHSTKWLIFNAVATKGIKAILLCRVGVANPTAGCMTSLPFSPQTTAWGCLSSAELETKLMEAKRVSESSTEGFKEIVSRIWGDAFYNEMDKRGRLQL